MFENPGAKLKSTATFLFILGVIGTIALAFTLNGAFIFVCLIVGCVSSYISALVLYGFGELVENSGKTDGTKKEEANKRKADIAKEAKREKIAKQNIAKGLEADADPDLTNEEIERILEKEMQQSK